jgi:hypothetical protein
MFFAIPKSLSNSPNRFGPAIASYIPFLFISGYGSGGRPEAFIEGPALQKPLMLSKLGETIDSILSSADAHATEKRRDPARVLRVPNTPGTASPSGPLGNAPADDRFCFATLVERCIQRPLISAPTDGVDGPVRRPYFGGWQLTLQPADRLIGFDRIGAVAFKTLEHARTFAAGRQRQNQAGRRNRALASVPNMDMPDWIVPAVVEAETWTQKLRRPSAR